MSEFPPELRPKWWQWPGLWAAKKYLEDAKEILMADLSNQPTAIPTRKVAAAGAGGVTAALLVWISSKFFGFEMGPEDAALFATAISVVLGYFVRERATK